MSSKASKKSQEERLTSAKENVLQIKRDILQIVELALEKDVSKEWFLKNCSKLCKQDYMDIIQERSIEHLCGYPFCNKPIKKIIKQQYHISRSNNKVYDLTERKCFCCNECYSASDYLKLQLSDLPLYMRKEEKAKNIKLLNDDNNRGALGEELVFHHRVKPSEVEPVDPDTSAVSHFNKLLQEDVKVCEEQLAKLEIKENVFVNPFTFEDETPNKSATNQDAERQSSSDLSSDGEDSDEDKSLFPDHDNPNILTDKLMPIPKQDKKMVLISPLKPTSVSQSSSPAMTIEQLNMIFQDWFTEDTMKYLMGEQKMYSLKADMLFTSMVDSDAFEKSQKLAAIKSEYIDLCLKIDKLQVEEDSDGAEEAPVGAVKSEKKSKTVTFAPGCETRTSDNAKDNPGYIPIRKPRKNPKGKKKSTASKSAVKSVVEMPNVEQEQDTDNTVAEPMIPLVDSVSQNLLRKKVLLNKLKPVYFDILPMIGVQYRDIREGVQRIIETFSLTPTNITFKPKEWICIALVIFKVLHKSVLLDLECSDDKSFSKLWESSLKHFSLTEEEVDRLSEDLISSQQLEKMQNYK